MSDDQSALFALHPVLADALSMLHQLEAPTLRPFVRAAHERATHQLQNFAEDLARYRQSEHWPSEWQDAITRTVHAFSSPRDYTRAVSAAAALCDTVLGRFGWTEEHSIDMLGHAIDPDSLVRWGLRVWTFTQANEHDPGVHDVCAHAAFMVATLGVLQRAEQILQEDRDDGEEPPTVQPPAFRMVLVEEFGTNERRHEGLAAAENLIRDLRRLQDELDDGRGGNDDVAALGRWQTVLAELRGMPVTPVSAMNGAIRDAARLIHRLDPPQLEEIEEQLADSFEDPDDVQTVARLVVELEDALTVGTADDGSDYNEALAIAAELGQVVEAQANVVSDEDPDSTKAIARRAAQRGLERLIENTVASPMKTVAGVTVSLSTTWLFLTEVRPGAAALLRWAFAALKQTSG